MESQAEENKAEGAEMTPEEQKVAEAAIAVTGAFNYGKLIRMKQNIIKGFANNNVPMADYGEMLHEWTRLFKHLGKGMSLAFSGKY